MTAVLPLSLAKKKKKYVICCPISLGKLKQRIFIERQASAQKMDKKFLLSAMLRFELLSTSFLFLFQSGESSFAGGSYSGHI